MALTPKQEAFCREYITNGGNATRAYLTAYDSKSPVSAAQEGYRLLQNADIQECIKSLNKPLNDHAIAVAMTERERKRAVLWDIIQRGDDNAKCRALDILNKMDAEYINVNHNITDNATKLSNLDTEALQRLTQAL